VLYEIVLSHYPRKNDLCCFGCVTSSLLHRVVNRCILHLIFAVLLPNLIRPIVCQIFYGSRDYDTPLFREIFYHASSAFQRRRYVPNLKSLAQAVFESMFNRMPQIYWLRDQPRPFGDSYLCMQSVFYMRSY